MARSYEPRDVSFFAPRHVEKLRTCVFDLSWLLGRGYSRRSALKFIGEVHQLSKRQLMAVMRSSCSEISVQKRKLRKVKEPTSDVYIDTYNLIILLERAWGGGVVLRGKDGCLRDIASVHGSYRIQEETELLIQYCIQHLATFRDVQVHWLIDAPVSNSRNLLKLVQACGGKAQSVHDVDQEIIRRQGCVITSDVVILDATPQWYPLAETIIQRHIPNPWIVDLG